MPLYRDFSDKNAQILIWKYDENEVLNVDQLLTDEEKTRVLEYHPVKLKEFLMVRQLLKSVKPNSIIGYNEREPFLVPHDAEISITHSFPFSAIAISSRKIGIDMERFRPKILNIIDKFVYPEERGFIPDHKQEVFYTIIWSLKESMYKLHHSKYWSLKKNYEVMPFTLETVQRIKCRVYDSEFSDIMTARVEFFDDFCFTIVEL